MSVSLTENKPYLASCVIQSQQILLSTNVDTHCKEMTKSFEGRKGREGTRVGNSEEWG